MFIVDSHCHLKLLEDRGLQAKDIIEEARLAGVQRIQNISVSLNEFEKIYAYSREFDNVYSSIGVHPLYCEENEIDFSWSVLFERYISNPIDYPKINSIGECGLDYSKINQEEDFANIRLQQKVFLLQIDFADRYELPIIIHTRDAEEDTYSLLSTAMKLRENLRGVMHCFTGTEELAWAMVELGFYISFSGIITFRKKAEHLQRLATELPLDKILVETDSPYLSPEPFRGKDNVPARTRQVVEKIASLRGLTIDEVADQTTKNYFALFNKSNML